MEQRILILADSASSHAEKWALALAGRGYKIGLFSLNKASQPWYNKHKNIELLYEPRHLKKAGSLAHAFNCLLALPKLLKKIKTFKPDIVHAHYATSYGLLGALTKFKPFVLSVLGPDIFEFPKKSPLHQYILKFNLGKADKILSTSYDLKGELWNYTSQNVQVIPFGVDVDVFYPAYVKTQAVENITNIGTIQPMEDQYGIKTIIGAIKLVKFYLPYEKFKLFLVGDGSRLSRYKKLATEAGLSNHIIFTGQVPAKNIPYYHNLLDIFLNASKVNESFSVPVIEAMACAKPVILSDVPGLKEIAGDIKDMTFVVERGDEKQLAAAIIQLMLSPELRLEMGTKARQHVLANYDFEDCLDQVTDVYSSFSGQEKKVPGLIKSFFFNL